MRSISVGSWSFWWSFGPCTLRRFMRPQRPWSLINIDWCVLAVPNANLMINVKPL